MLDDFMFGRERVWTPAIDVVRDNGNLVVRGDIPGIKPEEVKIEVEDDILTISGEHEERKDEKDKNYVRRERLRPAGPKRRKASAGGRRDRALRLGAARPRWRSLNRA
jgi:HSP20 family protein